MKPKALGAVLWFLAGVVVGMIFQIEIEIQHTPNYAAIEAEQRKRGYPLQRG